MASVAAAAPAGTGTSASHPYTCNTCQVAYRNIDLQKGHMKSDWHRYNLKRRVASLPPISSEVFTEKVLQARATSSAEAEKAYFEAKCEPCNKTYYSENAYQNHLLSQKHKTNEAAAGGPRRRHDDEATSVISSTFSLGEPTSVVKDELDTDAEDEFNQVIESLQNAKVSAEQRPSPVSRPSNPKPTAPGASKNGDGEEDSESTTPSHSVAEPTWTLNSCIFCNFESPSLPLSVQHMERFHGMFIPERPYLADLQGLIKQLQRKVSEYHECLSCGKVKSTVFGVQTHMRDKGHCKIPFSTEEEQLAIGDFYDFRSTYSDNEEEDEDDGSDTEEERRGGAKLGSRRKARLVGEDGEELDGEEDGEGWETDSSASSLDSADLTAVPAEGHIHQYERLNKHPHHSSRDPRNHHQADGWHSRAHKHTHAAFYDDYELHLPSGKSVGHRSLNKYFRQNLNNYPTPEERAERLAIEGPESGEESHEKDRSIILRNGQRFKRDVVPRGTVGLANVSDEKRRAVRKSEHRGRDLEQFTTKRTDWMYGKRNNNQKHYYYRFDGGG
ncbi:C2H2 type zinc-finger domain protein [Metarhizium robertsii]|uniref:C2H2 finger domain-containing protein n=2 Tax=Metarhizium robertsii TaxID=568076 RepID=E9ENU8_METRA|nr:C2H2 finger domain-containing protein [Metarhizium robertsii ARSEF 23]EFZ02375.1 C2H2 finger domain-containing protein [Metarhizium robertsii ARSEF 23]EXV05561.1 C2H2 type zinc-finger domain protein [Metarhizium robertsii]